MTGLAREGDTYSAADCDADRKVVVLALLRIADYSVRNPQLDGRRAAPLLRFAADLWDGGDL